MESLHKVSIQGVCDSSIMETEVIEWLQLLINLIGRKKKFAAATITCYCIFVYKDYDVLKYYRRSVCEIVSYMSS